MPRFAANLTLLFNEVGFLERFEAARRAGFLGVEYLFPYAHEPAQLVEQLERHGLTQVLHNLPAGDWAAGERGIACLPGRTGEFQDGVGKALTYARALRCSQLNCLAGIPTPGLDPERAEATLVDNLRFAARALKAEGIRLLVEPINTRDIPGFFLSRTAQALRLIDATGEDNVFLQYDVYHMHVMEGDLVPTLTRNIRRIAHVQIADTPGRNEPGTGEINYPFVLAQLDALGYPGWVGCEYKPRTETVAGLGWLAPYRAR
jgi:hydroxypyruvate isomerase